MTISDTLPVVTLANHVPGPKQGWWTYKDYVAIAEDGKHYEVVNGVLYMTPSPSGAHQDAVLELASYLRAHVKLGGLGIVRVAPFDVELAPNVIVQPDVLVVLNTGLDKVEENRIIGAPDLVVEVAFPSTATYDRDVKKGAYARAGVPEYWIVDPEARTAEVLILQAAGIYHSLGIFRRKATLPSQVVAGFPVNVEQFFM